MRPPSLEVEQWVAAQLLLDHAGQIEGRTQDYWRKARDLAQQHLHINPDLEGKVGEEMSRGHHTDDLAFAEMLDIVKHALKQRAANPYHQAMRDEYAVENGLFHHIKDSDITMILDKNDKVIGFFFSDAFRKLLSKNVEKRVMRSLDIFSTLQPVPLPDMTRHGLHWIDWLVENPPFDYRNTNNDPRAAKSGVYHLVADAK